MKNYLSKVFDRQAMNEKVLILITNLGKGGAQRVFYDNATALSKKFEVHEAVFNRNEDERIYNSGLPLYSLDVEKAKRPWNKLFYVFKRAKRLRKIIREKKIDLVISHMDGANWVNVLSKTKAKKILVVHGTILHDLVQRGIRQWIRRFLLIPYLYNKASVTVAVSKGIKYELKNLCKVRNAIDIPNCFDIAFINSQADIPLQEDEKQIFDQHRVLITSGRFHEQKQQKYLFNIFSEIKKTFAKTKLVLLGDGELRLNLMEEAKKEGLSYYSIWNDEQVLNREYDVYFLGYKKNPFQYLKNSTLFLFPSGWEGFPLALCEAMIAGVPVLSADCPTGPREILSPNTVDLKYKLNKIEKTPYGCLLPMSNKKEFKEKWITAIKEYLGDGVLRTQAIQNAKERMKEYDQSNIQEKWNNLIDKTLSA
jgi:glycosyltransferase involved in cell wall biosynthesis